MCDPRYEKEDPNEDLLQLLELNDLKEALIGERCKINTAPNKAEKINLSFRLIKKTPSISDVAFIRSLMLGNHKLDRVCSEKMKVLQSRRERVLKNLRVLLR